MAAAGSADDPDPIEEDCKTLVKFYDKIGCRSFATTAKATEIITGFRRRAENSGHGDWRETMYTEFINQRGIDPRLALTDDADGTGVSTAEGPPAESGWSPTGNVKSLARQFQGSSLKVHAATLPRRQQSPAPPSPCRSESNSTLESAAPASPSPPESPEAAVSTANDAAESDGGGGDNDDNSNIQQMRDGLELAKLAKTLAAAHCYRNAYGRAFARWVEFCHADVRSSCSPAPSAAGATVDGVGRWTTVCRLQRVVRGHQARRRYWAQLEADADALEAMLRKDSEQVRHPKCLLLECSLSC